MNVTRVNQYVVKTLDIIARTPQKELAAWADHLEALILNCAQNMRLEGATESEIDSRLFALCALCDEVYLAPLAGASLPQYSLMRKRFANDQAGVDFYQKAEALAESQDSALMVYWVVFRCGFRGCLEGDAIQIDAWERAARAKVLAMAPAPLPEKNIPSKPVTSVSWLKVGGVLGLSLVFYVVSMLGSRYFLC